MLVCTRVFLLAQYYEVLYGDKKRKMTIRLTKYDNVRKLILNLTMTTQHCEFWIQVSLCVEIQMWIQFLSLRMTLICRGKSSFERKRRMFVNGMKHWQKWKPFNFTGASLYETIYKTERQSPMFCLEPSVSIPVFEVHRFVIENNIKNKK